MGQAKVRIDKWLWAVRLYKTRSKASDACQAGRVKLNEEIAKPAKTLSLGDVIQVRKKNIRYTFKVEQLIDKRVGAPIAVTCYTDLTPEEEKAKEQMRPQSSVFYVAGAYREKGMGRPTKKERRDLDDFTWQED